MLEQLLADYRNGAPFPSYSQLLQAAAQDKLPELENALARYRNGGLYPCYEELARLI